MAPAPRPLVLPCFLEVLDVVVVDDRDEAADLVLEQPALGPDPDLDCRTLSDFTEEVLLRMVPAIL